MNLQRQLRVRIKREMQIMRRSYAIKILLMIVVAVSLVIDAFKY